MQRVPLLAVLLWGSVHPSTVAAGSKERITPATAVRDLPTLTEFLDEYEADVQDHTGQTVLHWAASIGSISAADYALEQGGHIDKADHEGRTPLHIAALSGHAEVVQRLLQRRALPSTFDASGATALHRAALAGSEGCVALLARAAPKKVDQRQHRTEGTALHAAAYLGHTAVIQALLSAGASPCLRDREGRRPIDRWVEEDHDLVAVIAEEPPVVDEENRKDVIRLLHEGSRACSREETSFKEL
eukprot:TRINITY_DN41092_c0_g1_i1.p1 TRINITY_DN41092_c0_g1~~TRINITY_DN41092_c0_g1_i1.p1  ORF type:complete len:245 (+),score=37.98 TRINITY_DN41092_c0_g1_i1:118-852(+)